MALVADPNFTNNLVSVAGFSPFVTSGGNKVLKMDTSGVLIDNDVDVSNIGNLDVTAQALISSTPSGGSDGSFGFILNRNVSGAFYYLLMNPVSAAVSIDCYIYRYSGGAGGSFTLLAFQGRTSIVSPNTIFTATARVQSSTRGPNLSLLINGQVMISDIDLSVSAITSGQPGVAANIAFGTGTNFTRYMDNYFSRQII